MLKKIFTKFKKKEEMYEEEKNEDIEKKKQEQEEKEDIQKDKLSKAKPETKLQDDKITKKKEEKILNEKQTSEDTNSESEEETKVKKEKKVMQETKKIPADKNSKINKTTYEKSKQKVKQGESKVGEKIETAKKRTIIKNDNVKKEEKILKKEIQKPTIDKKMQNENKISAKKEFKIKEDKQPESVKDKIDKRRDLEKMNKTSDKKTNSDKKNTSQANTSDAKFEDPGLKAKDLLERRKEKYAQEKQKEEEEKSKGFFKNLKEKLTKSRQGLFKEIKNFFTGRTVIDDDMYDELEDLLIQSDIGMNMTLKIVEKLRDEVKIRKVNEAEQVYEVLKDVLDAFLIKENNSLKIESGRLNVVLIVGVNGVGKTTTIGKMAAKLKNEGKKVIIGAADTFRAAAIEQLEEWANRADVELIKNAQGSDPGAVVFDTLKAAKNRNADVAIIDTAGRLHNKSNLMKELEKIHKIIKSHIGEQDYESLLVLDGTTGQNGLSQAKAFNEITDLTGLILTKLDGTAKGGIIFSVSEELKKPVKFIGVGEGLDDLQEFDSTEFISAIFE